MRVRSVSGLVVWPDGRKASDSSLISTPFEGMPASLGPGLRTVSGAPGHSSMFAPGARIATSSSRRSIAQFPPLSAARRHSCARQFFRPWHRPHNTAIPRGGPRRILTHPVNARWRVDRSRSTQVPDSAASSEFTAPGASQPPRKRPRFSAIWSLPEWHTGAKTLPFTATFSIQTC